MNKKNLNMSTRDRNLIILLGLAIVAFICYMYIVSPALQRGASLKADLSNLNDQITVANENIAKLPDLKRVEGEQKAKLVEKYMIFFYEINQERILNKIDSLIASSGISVTAYTPTPINVGQISVEKPSFLSLNYPLQDLAGRTNPSIVSTKDQKGSTSADVSQVDSNSNVSGSTDTIPTDSVPFTDITIELTNSSYPSVINFIGSLENMKKSIIIKSIELVKMDTPGIQGQIVISLYSIPKLDDADKEYLKFLPVVAIGKVDPYN